MGIEKSENLDPIGKEETRFLKIIYSHALSEWHPFSGFL
jgi:hypothetical protein